MNRHELRTKSRRGSILLVAEGDSWFDFGSRPAIVTHLRRSGYAVSEVADPSHTLEFMATAKYQKKEFTGAIKKLARQGLKPTAVLLSGGGNDLIDRLPLLLNQYDPETPVLNKVEVNDFANNHIEKLYRVWLNFISNTCDQVFGDADRIPIIVHGYAYVVPDGRGILPFYHWLKKEFRDKGHRNLPQNTKTMATLVDVFNGVLSGLAGNKSFNNVHYVDLRNVLSNDLNRVNGKRKYKEDWSDEIHPTNEGFAKVVAELSTVIDGF